MSEQTEIAAEFTGKVEFTATSLRITGDLSWDEWKTLGRTLREFQKSVHWWIGDWLNYGEQKWGEMYAQAIDQTGYDYGTLANAKYVASRFQSSPRSEKLSFSHHKEVAALPPEQAQALLWEAETYNFTVSRLKEEKRALLSPQPEQEGNVMTEHDEQAALIQWAGYNVGQYPELDLMYAIPNGGKRDKATAARLAQEGVKAGVPDLCLPVPRGAYHGYYIELKIIYPDGTRNQPSEEQRDRITRLREQGYKAEVFWNWQEAAESILSYLEEGR